MSLPLRIDSQADTPQRHRRNAQILNKLLGQALSAGASGDVQLSNGSGGFTAGTVPMTVNGTTGAISAVGGAFTTSTTQTILKGVSINVASIPSGTLVAPPAGLNIGDLWVDTTTSAQYPIVRMRAS